MTAQSLALHDGFGKAANALNLLCHLDGQVTAEFASARPLAGCFVRIGARPEDKILVAVDFDSGEALHAVTGAPVAVCLYYENLEAVCSALRIRYPDVELVIAAGGALASGDRARELVCAAALKSKCSVAHAPGGRYHDRIGAERAPLDT
jgi:phage/plasmid primase-like uncharacterized protein